MAVLMAVLSLQAVAQLSGACPLDEYAGEDYQNPLYDQWLSAYDVKYYNLQLHVSNLDTEISGFAIILVEATRELDTLVLELQDSLWVTDVYVSDDISTTVFTNPVSYNHQNGAIYIALDRSRTGGELFAVRVHYHGKAGQERGFFAGINQATDSDYGFDVTYTLSEPLNGSDWFPVKQVLEDKIDSVRFTLACEKGLMAASNGTLLGIEESGEDTLLFTWLTRYPMAYYLLSFTVADYRDYSFYAALSSKNDSVLVQNYIYDSDALLDDWEEGIKETARLITTYSGLLTDYPFSKEKYGHAMAPLGGGMEHQTMTTIHNFGFYLVAHELAHQWFGDYVTCGNWQDIWINEGFASYMEYVAAQELKGQEAADDWMDNAMNIALQEREGSVYVPEELVEDPYRLFDYGLTYKKGAILLHMIRYHLNDDDLFFGILGKYLKRYGNGLATGKDFQDILESESGMDFSCFFDQWYYGEGYPRFSLHWTRLSDSLYLQLEQLSTAPAITPFFRTPFDLEVLYTDGTTMRYRLQQDEAVQQYTLPGGGEVETVYFDPDNILLKNARVIHEQNTENVFTYGPNPVTGELVIHFFNASRIDQISITNMSGQEIARYEDMANPASLNLSALAAGTYVLVMSGLDKTYKEYIVKVAPR